MSKTPAQQFLSDLEAYVDVRIEKGTLHLQRMHQRERDGKAADLENACDHQRDQLFVSISSLMRDAKRPGI